MTIKAKVIAINKLLSDIEQRSMRLNYLLADMEFSEEDIKFIADNLLQGYFILNGKMIVLN